MKHYGFFLLYILINSSANASFLKDYAALKNTSNFSESHYVSYCDSITGKGGGLFSWNAEDVHREAWGLIIKSARNDKKGSWVRQDVTDLHPEWFGATNKKNGASASFRSFGYSVDEIRQRYSIYIPDISLDDTPDWASLQMMCRLQEDGWNSIELNSGDYFINRPIILPQPVKASNVVHYQLEGNGAVFISTSAKGFPFLYSMPSDQKQSENIFSARRFTIKDLILKGNRNVSGDNGIEIGGTFHSLFENIQFSGLDSGIILRHALSSIIYRCNAVGCKNVSYYIASGNGAWLNANSTNSGSNQTKVISCRQFTGDHQYAGVQIVESSECRVEDFTLDGGGKRHTCYAVYFDTHGSTTVKDGYVKGVHGESAIDSALVKFRGSGSLFEVTDLFVQYACNLVELEVISGYAQVTCSDFSYFTADSRLANKGNGRWLLMNVTGKNKEILWRTDNGYAPPPVKQLKNDKKL
jgi:hypothetical protein